MTEYKSKRDSKLETELRFAKDRIKELMTRVRQAEFERDDALRKFHALTETELLIVRIAPLLSTETLNTIGLKRSDTLVQHSQPTEPGRQNAAGNGGASARI